MKDEYIQEIKTETRLLISIVVMLGKKQGEFVKFGEMFGVSSGKSNYQLVVWMDTLKLCV